MSTSVVKQAIPAREQIIQRIAESGSCVIVGCAADHVLCENPQLFRVFIHAPKKYRVKMVMEM
ncbi:MAG: cytidylate kinase family protein [Eubacteriales bacterium]|nr:cytidylate kinase family protein [Eubacteriales bacterium]